MISATTTPNNATRKPRIRQPPQPLLQSKVVVLRDTGGWIGGWIGGARRVCALLVRPGDSYATGETRVPSMSSSSTRRGRGILSLSRGMLSGGVRCAGLALVVAAGSAGSSSFGSTGISVRVSASESISLFKNCLFSSSLLFSSSSLVILHQICIQTLKVSFAIYNVCKYGAL